ncbi:MAG TPA: hypothetical protein VML55_16185 [Planctomycetaceae bacterium]|nr:hypothetical protein [Planctomycetaceae bacterium]
MNRHTASILLTVLGGLWLADREAAAQQPGAAAPGEPQPVVSGTPLPPAAADQAGTTDDSAEAYVECQCERCRRARGELRPDRGLTRVLEDLWRLEQRKNAFLKRTLFGD